MACVQSHFPIKVLGGASTVAPSLPIGPMRAIYAGNTSRRGKADRQRKRFFCHDATGHRNAATLPSDLIPPAPRACARTGAKIRGNSRSTPFPTPCFSRDLSIDRAAASDTRRRTLPTEPTQAISPACARNGQKSGCSHSFEPKRESAPPRPANTRELNEQGSREVPSKRRTILLSLTRSIRHATAASDAKRQTLPSELTPSLPPAYARNEFSVENSSSVT